MKEIILVGAGGFIGASLRYLTSNWLIQSSRLGFPVGTFSVNLLGCTLLGIFVGLGLEKNSTLSLREFVAVGVLGGFTTFSTFGLELFKMLQAGYFKMTAIFMLGSVFLGLGCIGLGIFITR